MDLKWCLELIITVAVLNVAVAFASSPAPVCSPGMETWGYTVPAGDIAIEYGNPLDIKCVLHEKYRTGNASGRMRFIRNNDTVPEGMVEIVDPYTIRLRVEKPPKVLSDNYACHYIDEGERHHVVCMNVVSVGTKPEPVTDFECIGRNYDNLTCTWTPPQNYVKTTYNLLFRLKGRASRLTNNECPELTKATEDNPKMSCFYNVSTKPQYRQAHEEFNFTLTMENCFGKREMVEIFKHFQHVLSGPPENLTEINKTASSIYLSWVVPYSMRTFPPGLHHRVLYQCEYMEKIWQIGGILTQNKKSHMLRFNLTGLPYAHALCDIRVSIRSADALADDESMWSQNTSITLRTGMRIPDRPPETNIGSFQQQSSGVNMQIREAFIYWKQINDWEKSGPEFRYVVKVVEDEQLRPSEVTNAYAKFSNLSISKSYTFHVWSSNHEGTSLERSTVFLPKQNNKIGDPASFIKVEFSEGTYELTWEPPKLLSHQQVKDYTIFWCSNDRERPHQCTGHLNWRTLPHTARVHNETVRDPKQVYQFAISANSANSSSGMVWSDCTVLHNKSMGKMKTVWINKVEAYSIELGWKLDCADRIGSVQGFIVYYCPIISPTEPTCKGAQRNVTFQGDTSVEKGTVRNLTPYTTYMLSVAVITKHTTFSQQSDYLFNTTRETAPSTPPLNIKILDVTNNSIALSWQPPGATNGVLKYYEVYYNTSEDVKRVTPSSKNLTIDNYTLDRLDSYHDYNISVRACTTDCSQYSSGLFVHTEIGYPGKISTPSVRFQNDTIMRIGWDKPKPSGGRIDYYDVQIRQKRSSGNRTLNVSNLTKSEYDVINCGDNGRYNTFYVSVRAVNVMDSGVPLEGSWSDELQAYCRPPMNLMWYLIAVAVVSALAGFGYAGYKLYRRYKDMKKVEVILPPGLEPAVDPRCASEKRQESRESRSPPDQELLLAKLSGDGGRHSMTMGGDSSGCSSGHESVTSSIASGTGAISSSSDSGTDQAATFRAEIRQSPYVAHVSVPPKAAYEAAEPPSSYVLTGPMVKTVNPGYIPLESRSAVADSAPGYVVAGMKNGGGYVRREPAVEPSRSAPGYVVAAISNGAVKNCKLD